MVKNNKIYVHSSDIFAVQDDLQPIDKFFCLIFLLLSTTSIYSRFVQKIQKMIQDLF